MTVPYWQDQSPEHTAVTADVVVVGAGISGASVAWWLKESGLDVAVVDRGDVCAGASGRNAGFVTCGSVEHFSRQVRTHGEAMALGLWRLSQDNLDLIEQHLVGDGLACDFRRRGTYSLAGGDHELRELAQTAEQLVGHGVRVEMVDEAHVAEHLGARHFPGGALYLDDGEVHPVKLVRGILDRSGARVFTHHEVHRIAETKDGVTVHTHRRTFHAGALVLATNGYSADLHPWFADKIYPTRGQIMVTAPVAPFLAAPCYANFVLDYFRQLADGRVLIGGFRQLAKDTEVGTADVVHPDIQRALEDFLRHHFPALAATPIEYRWSGTMGFSADSLPIIGALPGRTSLYLLGGYTGHGIGWGFKAGQLLANLILRGEQPPWVSARRFGG
jgi:gamma-glutamylputrescine oxidase